MNIVGKQENAGYASNNNANCVDDLFKYKEVTETITKLFLNPGDIKDDSIYTKWINKIPRLVKLKQLFSMGIPFIFNRECENDSDRNSTLSVVMKPTNVEELYDVINSFSTISSMPNEDSTIFEMEGKFGFKKIGGTIVFTYF